MNVNEIREKYAVDASEAVKNYLKKKYLGKDVPGVKINESRSLKPIAKLFANGTQIKRELSTSNKGYLPVREWEVVYELGGSKRSERIRGQEFFNKTKVLNKFKDFEREWGIKPKVIMIKEIK